MILPFAVISVLGMLGRTPAPALVAATQAPPQFPSALSARTGNLEFHVAPPSTGTLDTQVRTALRKLAQLSNGGTFIKLRLFAVGSAVLDSVRTSVAGELAKTRAPRPVLALVGVAGFPDSSQRVVVEATVAGRRVTNPDGLAFIAGVASPTGARTIAGLARVAKEAGVATESVLRISCFYEQTDQVASARSAIASTFPAAEASFVNSYAGSARPAIECEAVARLTVRPAEPVTTFNLPGGTPSPNYSHATLVTTTKLIFAGSEVAASAKLSAVRAMFEQVRTAVAAAGGSITNVVMGDNYWLTDASRDTVRVARAEYFGGTVPAATGVSFTSLPGAGAAAIELVIADRTPVRPDSLTLLPGSNAVDGRYLTPHRTEVTRTVTRAGVTDLKDHYLLEKSVINENGRPLFRLAVDALPDAPDPSLHVEIVLDHQTLAFVRRDDRDGRGRESHLRVDNLHVTGTVKPARDGATMAVDFSLPQPAFLSSFLDAAVNATELHEGLALRIPTFGLAPGQQTVAWHSIRITGRDTVRMGDHLANGWVAEEGAGPEIRSRRLWLLREPPYFPLDITVLSDGAVQRIEQRLLH